jgi:protein N-terminal amidase
MDLNPYQFKAPFESKEFSSAMLPHSPDMILCSNAWLMSEEEEEAGDLIEVSRPNVKTMNYWCDRLSPLLEGTADGKRIVVAVSNRTGKEGTSTFSGSSCVLLFEGGKASLLGAMAINEVGVKVVECR